MRRQEVAFGPRVKRLHAQHRVGVDERCVHRRAGDHAVVVGGVALHFRETLSSAGGASLPVAVLRGALIVARDDRFADHRRFVRGAMAEVDDAFGVRLARRLDRKRPVGGARARVAEIVLHDRVAAREPRRRSLHRHVARRTAAADAEHLAVPIGRQTVDGADMRALDR
jgi:hypothetical protein